MNEPFSPLRERILEAIDVLRNRKARPDITRISNYLFRRYQVSSAEAKAGLEWCVANSIVLRVEYKGNISYRNAAKKKASETRKRGAHQSYHQNKHVLSKLAINRGFMELLTNVFGELVVEEPDYLESGVPPQEIMEKILSKESARYTRRHAALLLVEEVQRGNLVKLDNGNFLLGPCNEKPKPVRKYQRFKTVSSNEIVQADTGAAQVKPKKKIIANIQGVAQVKPKKKMIAKMQAAARKNKEDNNMASGDDEKRSEVGNQRSGRQKKAKKVFDPSDTHIPKKRGRPTIKNTFIKKPKRLQVSRPDSPESSKDHDSRPNSPGPSKDNDSNSRPDSPGISKDHGGVCGVCFNQSKRGPDDRMVACKECSYKAHYGCLKSNDLIIDTLNPNTTWRCPHCKTCRNCFETSNAGDLIVCAVCADAYHATCHQPEITDKIEKGQKWLCVYCRATEEMKPDDIQANMNESFDFEKSITRGKESDVSPNSPSKIESESSSPYNSPPRSPSPPVSSPNRESESPMRESQSGSSSDKDSDDENESSDGMHSGSTSPEIHNRAPGPEIDPSIPDATNWTPDDVYQYFRQFLREDEAKVFKEQEIDGRSFLLLRRIDVLTQLNLMLGPALKVYRHLTMLQVRRDDKSLYWL